MSKPVPPPVSGGWPFAGHALQFRRDPLAVLRRGLLERGRIFSLRLGSHPAMALIGVEYDRYVRAETDHLALIHPAFPVGADTPPRIPGLAPDRRVGAMIEHTHRLRYQLGYRGELDLVDTLGRLLLGVAAQGLTGHLSWALIDLLRHPAQLARVRDEQAETLAALSWELDLAAIERLRLLDRALRETRRLHPSVPVFLHQANRAFEYVGYQVRQGTRVVTSPALSHRLPEAYPEPDRYQPDRFLTERGRSPRRRPGHWETKVIVTILLRDFDLELADPDPQPVRGLGLGWPQRPCRVRYQRRFVR